MSLKALRNKPSISWGGFRLIIRGGGDVDSRFGVPGTEAKKSSSFGALRRGGRTSRSNDELRGIWWDGDSWTLDEEAMGCDGDLGRWCEISGAGARVEVWRFEACCRGLRGKVELDRVF